MLMSMHSIKKKYSTIETASSRNILTNRRISDNAVVVEEIPGMSTVSGINCSCEVVQKDKSVAIGAFSLNGHVSLYSVSTKNAVLIVPTLAQKLTNM
jgi:hypothetical protein